MTFVRVMVFSLLVLLVFTGFANILPQVQSDPPAEEVVEIGTLDMAGLVVYGEKLFSGKGTCTLCHNNLGRAPDLLELDLAATFPARIGDPNYTGAAKGGEGGDAIEAYLRESFLDPSAYVVAGFGKKGTKGKVSPMPVVDAPPIELDAVQIDAVIAFLQDRAGLEPTVPLPSAVEAEEEDEEEGPASDALATLDKFLCSACHDLEGSEADIGPDLRGIAGRMSREEIMAAILDPNAEIAEGYEADLMPADLAEQMYVSEVTLIVDYLTGLSGRLPDGPVRMRETLE
jgi:mono/diheme cytochrome c family protein